MNDISVPDFKKNLGQRIKQLRLGLGLTQQQLASRMGYKDKQVVNRYEMDGANPTAYSLMQIAESLEVSLDELIDFSKLDS
ncbi:helix-turn-helix domain-containing protein [Pedobacter sp.]|jgi:transcriptional regulator with XRE-family HTH domain|uniref:helix-turn-helix domain-containing protein n=1 Tax=Pedobacter sp. TaxID=1411316 RepID=UPI0018EB3B1C|nr:MULTISPECIES: helix-turn-helix transcriptional regulator [unclassified Pedobacter]HWW40156.1 helix-turn-helix transcriptional regulator [Pedobacter sp.]